MDDRTYRVRLQAARNQVQHRLTQLNGCFVDLDLAVVHYKRLAEEAEESWNQLAIRTGIAAYDGANDRGNGQEP